MLSQYPVLDSKPIDQWRVTELREELRRRKLATKGLKEELVKRLNEAIQKEKQSENEAEFGNGVGPNLDFQNYTDEEDEGADNTQTLLDEDDNTDEDASMVHINHGVLDVNQRSEGQNGDAIEVTSIVGTVEENAATVNDLEGNVAVNQNATTSHSGMQDEDAKLVKFEELKPTISGTYEEKEANPSDLRDIAQVKQNITARSGIQDAENEDAELKVKFKESKLPIVETNEEKTTTIDDFDGGALVNSNVTQSGTQGEDANHVEKFDVLMPLIIGTYEEKEANTYDLEGSAPVNQNIAQSGVQGEDAEPEKFEELRPHIVDSTVIQSEQSDQVSEISQDLGFQVNYESNSTDSVSINEKKYIKDNLTADHFPLELEVVKQEMVQSSSSSYPTGAGDICMAGDEQEAAKYNAIGEQEGVKNEVFDRQEVDQNLLSDERDANDRNLANEQYSIQSYVSCQQEVSKEHVSLKDADAQNASTLVLPKKEDCVEAGSSEKLNLDRSSGDESMEEDVLESKHTEVDRKSEEPISKIEVKMVDAELEERAAADAGSKFSPEIKDVAVEDVKPALYEKRKLEEAEVGNNGAPKRHRRWNPDTIKVPEQQTPHFHIVMTPKNNVQPTPRRIFSRSNSALSIDSPKERIVPTTKKPATTSLRIDNFLRPFTLKAVQELLAQTGRVCDFWMDHIKTHCYVTYSSVEEATETRNAVYNLQWPPNGGRLLAAEFVDFQEVKSRLEVPPQSPAPISPTPATPKFVPPHQKTQAPQPTHQQNLRQLPLPPPPPLTHPPPPSPPLLSNPPPLAREQRLPPPPPKKPDPPVVTLDDLFKKTKATPRIYYLPLTEEQVGAKLAAKGKNKQV